MVNPFHYDKGQSLVEYALIFPLFMLLLLSIMEFSVVILSYDSIANAAREGARYGIIHPEDSAGIEAAARRSTIGLDQAALVFTISQPTEDSIQIEADYDYDLITGPIVEAFGGNPTLHLYTVTTMRVE